MYSTQIKIISLSMILIIAGTIAGAYFKITKPKPKIISTSYDPITAVLKETNWDDYIWPTDASHWMTSNFAEFRANHFHAGIDISTNMQEGYKVFASRDGWLHEITFEAGGYGWYEVIRHADGFYTCNAHLKSFPKKILDAYRKKQIELGLSYGAVRFNKDEVPVKKGEVIAFTGSTGAGPPHFHFEVRDTSFNPVNPCLAKNLRVKDSIAPVIQSVLFQPLDAISSVDSKYEKHFINVNNNSSVSQIPVIRGRVGLLVKAYDKAEEAKGSYTPYKIELLINNKKYFDVIFNRFQDSLYWLIRIDRDHELMRMQKGEYRKLFCEEGNLLSVYTPNNLDAGVISFDQLGAGKKNWKIVATDISGNKSSVSGAFIIAARQNYSVALDEASMCHTTLDEPINIASLDIEGKSKKGQWQLLKRCTGNELQQKIDFHFDKNNFTALKIFSIDSFQQTSSQVFITDPASAREGEMKVERSFHLDEIIYSITTNSVFTKAPEVIIKQGERKERAIVTAITPSQYHAVIKAWDGFSGKATTKISSNIGGALKLSEDSFTAFLISASNGGKIISDDGKFSMLFKKADVVHSMLCWIKPTSNDSASGYSVYPQEIPISGTPQVAFSLNKQTEKSFIKAVHPGISMRHSITEVSQNGSNISARFGYFLANYFLLRDQSPPSIDVNVSRRKAYPCIFKITDTGSGVNTKSIKVKVDGTLVNVEFREGSNYYYVPSDVFPKQGKEISIEAADRIGNVASVTKKLR